MKQKQTVCESIFYNYSISICSEGCVCYRAMILDEVLEKLEEISPSENEGENKLLDENIPIAKTSKEVTISFEVFAIGMFSSSSSFSLRKMVILLTRIQRMKQMFDCPIFQESSFCQKH